MGERTIHIFRQLPATIGGGPEERPAPSVSIGSAGQVNVGAVQKVKGRDESA